MVVYIDTGMKEISIQFAETVPEFIKFCNGLPIDLSEYKLVYELTRSIPNRFELEPTIPITVQKYPDMMFPNITYTNEPIAIQLDGTTENNPM